MAGAAKKPVSDNATSQDLALVFDKKKMPSGERNTEINSV
jgi:hypothetical protein